jgi:hypothetical protein
MGMRSGGESQRGHLRWGVGPFLKPFWFANDCQGSDTAPQNPKLHYRHHPLQTVTKDIESRQHPLTPLAGGTIYRFPYQYMPGSTGIYRANNRPNRHKPLREPFVRLRKGSNRVMLHRCSTDGS